MKRRNFENGKKFIELLILGNSHTYYGVNPEFLSLKGYNLANSTQSFFYDKEITLRYLAEMPNLKMAIIPVSYFSFYYNMTDIPEDWRAYAYKKFWEIKNPDLSCWDSRYYSYMMMYTPKESLKFLLNNFKTNLTEGIQENGYFRKDTSGNERELTESMGKTIVRAHTSLINFKEEQNNIEYLSELIGRLQERGIKVILLTTPVARTYAKFCDSSILLRNNKLINQIVSKYSNCFYKDYSTDSRFTIKDFGNNDHLNFIGARKFSSILNDEYVIPYLNSKNNKVQN